MEIRIKNRIKSVSLKVVICIYVLILISCSTTNKDTSSNTSPKMTKDLKAPFLTAPKVRKVWIPEKIENDKFIEGHYMWILEKTSSWSQ